MKVLLDKKLRKKFGQLGAVKLLPRLESKGLGSGVEVVDGAVLMLDAAEDVDEEPPLLVVNVAMLAVGLVVVSCLACNRSGRGGGSRRSKMRSVRSSNGFAICIWFAFAP